MLVTREEEIKNKQNKKTRKVWKKTNKKKTRNKPNIT
tara:strand:- start:2272 stop:2382 length:111 start_codon:yes stop_codon:yes gene_type:complete